MAAVPFQLPAIFNYADKYSRISGHTGPSRPMQSPQHHKDDAMTGTLKLPTLFAIALLAACSSNPEKSQDKAPDSSQALISEPTADFDSRCDADPVHDLIGEKLDNQMAVEARDKADARFLRITRPNQPVTMDYNSQRLNIDIDDAGVVLQVSCG